VLCHLRSIRRNCRPLIEAETAPKGAEDKPDFMASLKRCSETKLLGSIIDLELSDPLTGASHPPLTHPSRAWVGHPLELEASIARAIAESGRRIEVCVSDELRVPTALGLVKPAVVLPTWALRELSAAELNAVVLHEVAHLRRWDDWTNLAQKLLRAVFFFHPAVWWVESRLSLEREMACDDMVLAQTENPRAYAECLVSLAEKNLLQRGVALAQAAVGRMRQTTARVLQILDPRRTKTSGVWTPAPWVVAGFSVVCLLSAGHGPRLIAFGDPASASPAVMSATSPTAADDNASFVPLVVPAAYHETRSNSELAPQRTKAAKAGAAQAARTGVHNTSPRQIHVRSRAEIAIQAVHRTTGQQAVPLVHAAYTEDAPVVVMQQAVFVFIRDSRFGAAVPVIWRVSVWNFTVLPAAPSQAGRELPSKSI
jgi:hypothetical protein